MPRPAGAGDTYGGLRSALLNGSTEVGGDGAPVVGSDDGWRQQVAAAQQAEQRAPLDSPGFGAIARSTSPPNKILDERRLAALPAISWTQRAKGLLQVLQDNTGAMMFLLVLSVVQGGVVLWAVRSGFFLFFL